MRERLKQIPWGRLFSNLTSGVLTLFGLLVVTFFIGRKIPVDPVLSLIGESANPAVYEKARVSLGLHLPVYEQFWIYFKNILHGDLGYSFLTSRPVLEDLLRVFAATVELSTLSLFVGALSGVFLGIWAAQSHGGILSCKRNFSGRILCTSLLVRPFTSFSFLFSFRLGPRTRALECVLSRLFLPNRICTY